MQPKSLSVVFRLTMPGQEHILSTCLRTVLSIVNDVRRRDVSGRKDVD